MNKEYCEKVRISAMAILDGEVPQLSSEELNEHIQSCAHCRHELEQQKVVIGLLSEQSRRLFSDDIWSRIAAGIAQSRAKQKVGKELLPLAVLGLILLIYKIIEVLPGFTPGLFVKLMPLVPVFVFFCLLKQNPFKINQNLRLEGDIRW
ncbi:MAG: zf-HC2 domain-containing protein [Planctomycetota bacterium]|jgi:predicted anti-sigma-YlaC factor YlaD